MNNVQGQGRGQSALSWSSERQDSHDRRLNALARFRERYTRFLDAMAEGDVDAAEAILKEHTAQR
jgi:DNA-binding GntR family transcriptional regulator